MDLKRELVWKKKRIYEQLCWELSNCCDRVKYFNISMESFKTYRKASQEFRKLVEHLTNKQTANYIMNKMSTCCIRSVYYLFGCRDKPCNGPKLLSWWNLFQFPSNTWLDEHTPFSLCLAFISLHFLGLNFYCQLGFDRHLTKLWSWWKLLLVSNRHLKSRHYFYP